MMNWTLLIGILLLMACIDAHLRFRAKLRKAAMLVDEGKARTTAKLCAADMAVRWAMECRQETGKPPPQYVVDQYRADMYELCRWIILAYHRTVVFDPKDTLPEPVGGKPWGTEPQIA